MSERHDRATIRDERLRHIRMRRRDWMTDPAQIGSLSKTKMGRGCVCERCIGGRTYKDSVNNARMNEALKEVDAL